MDKKWHPISAWGVPAAFGSVFILGGSALFYTQLQILQGAGPFIVKSGRKGSGRILKVVEDPTIWDMWPWMLVLVVAILVGVFIFMAGFIGFEVDNEGITYVNTFRRRKRVLWSEVTGTSEDDSYLTLKASSGDLRVFKGKKWALLRAELAGHMPQHFKS
jgi:hypothetical protein